jgi:hypothetical protein
VCWSWDVYPPVCLRLLNTCLWHTALQCVCAVHALTCRVDSNGVMTVKGSDTPVSTASALQRFSLWEAHKQVGWVGPKGNMCPLEAVTSMSVARTGHCNDIGCALVVYLSRTRAAHMPSDHSTTHACQLLTSLLSRLTCHLSRVLPAEPSSAHPAADHHLPEGSYRHQHLSQRHSGDGGGQGGERDQQARRWA